MLNVETTQQHVEAFSTSSATNGLPQHWLDLIISGGLAAFLFVVVAYMVQHAARLFPFFRKKNKETPTTTTTFFSIVPVLVAFSRRRRWPFAGRHRLLGVLYVTWLIAGAVRLFQDQDTNKDGSATFVVNNLTFDVVLGILGTLLTLSAASEFNTPLHHKKKAKEPPQYPQGHQQQVASGALDDDAIVTVSEMVEHSFYQILNVVQVVYLHALPVVVTFGAHRENNSKVNALLPAALALVATLPWLWRHRFPINHFSDNYTKGQNVWSVISVMYRLKKYQYMFYKHVLLHGLNATMAIKATHQILAASGTESTMILQLVHTLPFRQYWLGLNTAYTMEFFLQTLVRGKMMHQTTMLCLNQWLMVFSSMAAVQVLWQCVDPVLALVSMGFMFWRRGHDVQGMVIVLLFGQWR